MRYSSIHHKLLDLQSRLRTRLVEDFSTPAGRRWVWLDYYFMDHGFLRIYWHNAAQVTSGVLRSNQPSPAQIARLQKEGIRGILNLRGSCRSSAYLLEKESCQHLGIALWDISLSSRRLPTRQQLLELANLFATIERPFLMHCKSGADRTGFASALLLILAEGRSVEEAREQLSLRFLHSRWGRTGILDYFLDVYQAAYQESGIHLLEWIKTQYDDQAISDQFLRTTTAR